MASGKELKKRIKSVKNTSKITKTMEMVATAKSKRMMDRVQAARPYAEKISEFMDTLGGLKDQIDSPFLFAREDYGTVALLVITANRGLCGGYNSNVLKMARNRYNEYKEQGKEVELHVIGKKGISFFKFLGLPVFKSYTNIDDKFAYEDSEEITLDLMDSFASGRVGRVEIVSTIFYSSASQKPGIRPVLPLGAGEVIGSGETEPAPETEDAKAATAAQSDAAGVIFEPGPVEILENLIPLVIKTTFYRSLLEAVTAEQIYRRVAMKSATDAAKEMNKILTRTYNRIRQASITQELSEIVAGADAIG